MYLQIYNTETELGLTFAKKTLYSWTKNIVTDKILSYVLPLVKVRNPTVARMADRAAWQFVMHSQFIEKREGGQFGD